MLTIVVKYMTIPSLHKPGFYLRTSIAYQQLYYFFIHLHSNYQGMHLSPQNVSSHNTAVNILHTLIIRPPFGPTKLVLIVKRSLKKEWYTFKIDVLDQERWFKFNNRLSLILRGLNSKDYCTCITQNVYSNNNMVLIAECP